MMMNFVQTIRPALRLLALCGVLSSARVQTHSQFAFIIYVIQYFNVSAGCPILHALTWPALVNNSIYKFGNNTRFLRNLFCASNLRYRTFRRMTNIIPLKRSQKTNANVLFILITFTGKSIDRRQSRSSLC